MCRFIASQFRVILVFGCLGLVLVTLPLRAQNLRQWMPNVGDVFIYSYRYSSNINGTESRYDTCRIVGVDAFKDSSHPHAVVTSSLDFYFSSADSTDSFPFAVTSLQDGPSLGGNDFVLDFSRARVDTTIWNSDTMVVTKASDRIGWASYEACYSSTFHWFLNDSFYAEDVFSGRTESWSRTLIVALLAASGVKNQRPAGSTFFRSSGNRFLRISGSKIPVSNLNLLDPLGRPVRSWQFPASDGPRDITLNVADVPSGIYFLRISGDGIDEMKKVYIVH